MLQVKMINWRNLKISYSLTLVDLHWLKLTFKHQNFYIFGISEQFAIRKVPYPYIGQLQFLTFI
jgi:hypothetical protein